MKNMKLYISSYEYNDFEKPREILCYQKIKLNNKNCMVVKVNQPLNGQKYGLLGDDIIVFYLINRFDEQAFDKLDKFPIDVYVLIRKENNVVDISSLSELQNIAWACLYDNEKDAKDHRII
jgi:hypothetical protein